MIADARVVANEIPLRLPAITRFLTIAHAYLSPPCTVWFRFEHRDKHYAAE